MDEIFDNVHSKLDMNVNICLYLHIIMRLGDKETSYETLQAGIEFKKNLKVRFGKYGGLKLEYF